MTDTVQKTANLVSSALFGRRILIAPPSAHTRCWRIFAGGLSAEVRAHAEVCVCSYALKGPDGKTLRQGVARDLLSALRRAMSLLHDLSAANHRLAA